MGRSSLGRAGPFFACLAALGAALGAPAAVLAQLGASSIDFAPPGAVREGTPVAIRATFTSGVPPAYAYVFVRPIGQAAYLPLVLRINGNEVFGELPAALLRAPGIEYYLSVTDIDNQTVTFPAVAPTASPLRLTLSAALGDFSLTPIFPDEGLAVSERSPLFHFGYAGATGGLDTESFQLEIDGRRAASPCQFEEGEMFCQLDWEISLGTHSVVARVKRRSDGKAVEAAYVFSRGAAPRARPGKLPRPRGKAVARLVYLAVPNPAEQPSQMLIPSGHNRWFHEADLDSDAQVGGTSVKVLVRHNGIDRQEQPSPSRYSVRIDGGAASLDLGDFIAVWSDLGLSQRRMRGVQGGASFSDGRLRLDAVAGFTRRAIDRRDSGSMVLARHLTGVSASSEMRGVGLRLYALDARDDGASVPGRGSLDPIGTRQAGMAASLGLPRGFKVATELSFAAHQPQLGKGETQKGRGAQASVSGDGEVLSWSVLGRETRPGFVPLGTDSIQADYRGAEMQGSARLLGGKAVLSFSGQSYRDNTEDRKPVTFHAIFHQTNAMLQTWASGPSLLLGFGEQRQHSVSDSIPDLRTGNQNWLWGITQNLGPVSLGYNFSLSNYRDRSPQAFSNSFDLRTHSLNANWSGPKTGLSLSGQQSINTDLGNGNRSRTVGVTVQGHTALSQLRMEARHSMNLGKDQRSSIDNRQSNSAGQLEWRFGTNRFCRLDFEQITYSNWLRPEQSYRESRSDLSYGFSF